MRNNRDKWRFFKLPNREPLTTEQVMYFRNMLKKILKVGIEFEYNLPEKKNGTCKGDNNACPCAKLSPSNTCWQQCINMETCSNSSRQPESCTNKTETCEVEDCTACEHFAFECSGLFCPNFTSLCYACHEYSTKCDGCQFKYDPNKNPEHIRKHVTENLRPNNTYGQVSETGVHSITTDGSLEGKKGAEVITVGRRVDYWEFYKMSKRIIDLVTSKGGYLNERCSTHMHLLASYYGNIVPNQTERGLPDSVSELEKSLPEIVLANLHQLVRRYQNAMTWMMMGLDEQHRMTRWEKFRVSVLPVSAAMDHMHGVKRDVARRAGGKKYGWINYNQIGFDRNGDVSRFHVEFRAADGLNSPSAIAAIACLYYALAIKAVEISRYGVMEIGDKEWMDQTETVKEAMMNNMKGYDEGDRFADTSELHRYFDILIEESLDLVRQMKSTLINIGPAYEVLEKLAERPCALRRVDGQSWEEIEDDLAVIVTEEGALDIALSEIITLNQVADCASVEEWAEEVGRVLRGDPELNIDPDNAEVEDTIMTYVNRKREDGNLVWSKPIGAPILL